METAYLRRINEVAKLKNELEQKLNLTIIIEGHKIIFEGTSFDEYEASRVFEAISFGFSVKKALLLKEEDMEFKTIHIKKYTKRNLKTVLSRLIGKEGKTRRLLSEIAGCEILIKESEIGVLGHSENVEDIVTAIISLIRGAKQANVYRYLEKMNKVNKEAANLNIKD